MELETYEEMYRLEDRHWWFVGKRLLVRALLKDALAQPDLRILDVGCGTGGLLAHLHTGTGAATRAVGVDRSEAALGFCGRRGLRSVACAETTQLPFRASTFDVVLLLDVLEHVPDEAALLAEIRRVLRPGGTALISVPAYQWLWSGHDDVLHHLRRYTAARLERLLGPGGFRVSRLTYTNVALLFPAIVVRAVLPRVGLRPREGTDFQEHAPWVNRFLLRLYRAEATLHRYVTFPFGLSAAAVVTTPATGRRVGSGRGGSS